MKTPPPVHPPLLDVRGLTVAFGGKRVVHGVDLALGTGEKLALVGESGSGKTVTALALLQLAQNATLGGKAMLAGKDGGSRDLIALPERDMLGVRGDDIAMIFQEPMTALNPLYTVGDQVAEVIEVKQGVGKHEAWEAAICYIAEIRSDRDRDQDPILACLPGHLRWTIHRKRGQIAISTPPILGMAVQAWAGSAVFRPAGKGKIRLCTLPALLLEATGAIPVANKSQEYASCQPLFYVDSRLGISDIDGLLAALGNSFTRQRFS